MLLTYREVPSGADTTRGIGTVLKETLLNILDARLIAVIVLFSGFWMMLYQLWDLMPNFYADWTDSRPLVQSASWLPDAWLMKDARGVQLKQENAINLNAVLVVLLVVPISALVARLRVLTSISIGILIATCGTIVYGTSPSIWVIFLGISLFSLGEMLTGPKKTEYFSLIAPKGKKALYLGYVNIPIAIGQAAGAKLAGALYAEKGEKAVLAMRYLAERTPFGAAKGSWDGNVASLPSFLGIEHTAAFAKLTAELGQDPNQVNQLLWDTYHPYQVWFPFAAVGFAALLGTLVFARMSRRWADMDA